MSAVVDRHERCPVVGIGASAGGLDPLQEFVAAIPPGSGIAYVVVQHLPPDRPSVLDELLACHARLPVHALEDGMDVVPDRVFVAPGGHVVALENDRFRLARSDEIGQRTPIDRFFFSLADRYGEDAFCVVLSGTGSDGTEGLRRVKASGGTAIVQRGGGLRYSGMPDSASATGLVDFALEPRDMPGRIVDIVSHLDAPEPGPRQERMLEEIETVLPEIVSLLADDAVGHDFSGYKSGTLARRVERRMLLTHHRTVAGFVDSLRGDEDERRRLVQDFLIGVTRFFRDPPAFEALRVEVVPMLVKRAALAERPVRVWAPGSSTGEETYSIAMLLSDALEEAGLGGALQVFGTDIDAAALYHARRGIFSAESVADVGEKYAGRYLVAHRGDYRVDSALRERCVFALHNVVSDPAFSRMDLIVCRNLLIYLNEETQRSLVHKFHYALESGGVLFLGPSESLQRKGGLFRELNRKHRLFVRNDHASGDYSSLANGGALAARLSRLQSASARDTAGPVSGSLEERAERAFLRRLAAPFAVVDADDALVYLSEAMTRFVRPAAGLPSTRLDAFLAPELRAPARRLVALARSDGGRHVVDCRVEETSGERRLVRLSAAPLDDGGGETMLSIQPIERAASAPPAADVGAAPSAEHERLESDLAHARRELDAAINDREISSHELRGSNEELLSMNVELQSTNEELEISREELQSVNEELQTINAELNEGNDRLRRANSDMKNLFENAEAITLFLDAALRVRSFTPGATRLFGIRARDVGRPLVEIARRFEHETFEEDAASVLRSLEAIEREIDIGDEESYILRIRPYRTVDDRLDGLVVTFFDISSRRRQERRIAENDESLKRQLAELETLYATTPVGLSLIDRDHRWLRMNEKLAEINGFAVEEHIGKRQQDLIPEIDSHVAAAQRSVFETGRPVLNMEVSGTTPAEPDRVRDWIADYYPVKAGGEVFAVGCCVRDVSDQKALERELREYADRLRLAARLQIVHLHEIDAEGRLRFALAEHPALPNEDALGEPFVEALPATVRTTVERCIERAIDGEACARDTVELHVDDAPRAYELRVGSALGDGGRIERLLLLWLDARSEPPAGVA